VREPINQAVIDPDTAPSTSNAEMLTRLLKPTEVAERLGVSRSTAYELIQTGDLPSLKIGRCRRVLLGDLARFIEHQAHITLGDAE